MKRHGWQSSVKARDMHPHHIRSSLRPVSVDDARFSFLLAWCGRRYHRPYRASGSQCQARSSTNSALAEIWPIRSPAAIAQKTW